MNYTTYVCTKCGAELQVRTNGNARVWHGACPKRKLREQPPMYVKQTKGQDR